MSRRLPLAIACLALVVALSGVGPADAARAVKRARFANNAAKVNGIGASRKPLRNSLVPLGANATFPKSVIPSSLRGPRGPQGPVGPAGPAGPSGALDNAYVFRAHRIVAQDTAAGKGTKVVLGGEDFDPHGDFDPVSSHYTAPVTGYYQFSASVGVCCVAGRMFATIVASRAEMSVRGTDSVVGGSTILRSVASGLTRLQAGDSVELQVYTSVANTLSEPAQTYLSGHLVAIG